MSRDSAAWRNRVPAHLRMLLSPRKGVIVTMPATRQPSFHILTVLFIASAFTALSQNVTAAGVERTDPNRIDYIAGLLAEKPTGFGSPITDRQAWRKLGRNDSFGGTIARAEKLLGEPIPEQPDDLYLDFSRTGNRTRWQRVSGLRRGRIATLVLAECLEDKGRFLPAFAEVVRALCSERTWVMPAHDRNLENFNGKIVDIDLGSSMLAWSLATADYLLADRLSDGTRQLIRKNLDQRIFQPYRDMVQGKRSQNWWMSGTNNWNAVCLAGVTGSALAVVESRESRAFFIDAAERHSRNFLKGFTDDGYCSEGLGYWNYGFGYYVMLSETIHQSTGGKLDLLANEKARQAAAFGARMEIINGVYPAFADCSVSARPSPGLMYFVSRRFGLGLRSWEEADTTSAGGSLYQSMMYSFDNSASRAAPAQDSAEELAERSWFDRAGVLISRPGPGSSSRMGVALKAGHNAEHHNHNDVGSFVVVLGNKPLLLDPGGEIYTARTFSGRRYESNVLNSFGHPVPVVAGKLQRTGAQARGRITQRTFAANTDTLALDITSAYDVPQLERLERKFVYSRLDAGALTVRDRVAFSQPSDFGTALVTFSQWRQLSDSVLMIYDGPEALRVEIEVAGGDFEIRPETIKEDLSGRRQPTRLGIDLRRPVTHAVIGLVITHTKQPNVHSDAAADKTNSDQNTGQVLLDFELGLNPKIYGQSNYKKPPQFAIWLEQVGREEIRTVWVTEKTGTGDWGGNTVRPVSLPYWAGRWRKQTGASGFPTPGSPVVDAVTGATPERSFSAAVKVPAGSIWDCYIEINVSGDYNSAFPELMRDGTRDEHGNGQPSIIYKGRITARPGRSCTPEIVGRTDQTAGVGSIIADLKDISSAGDLLSKIGIACRSSH
jgi:hypothetical protein